MSDIDLGFAEEREGTWLTNRYFPSKIGGLPAWLELDKLPSKEDLECANCNGPTSFLCQIYAPFDDEHNFHRSIFVFICRKEQCQLANSSRNLIVLRSQLPRENKFYSSDPPAENGTALPTKKLCLACGCVGPLLCSRCKKANYCSKDHQRADWPQHKQLCSIENAGTYRKPLQSIVFPEQEIVIENCKLPAGKANDPVEDDRNEKERLAEYEKLVAEGKTGELADISDSELEKYVETSSELNDKQFRKFKKEIKNEPEQIIRYKCNAEPLWISDVGKTLGNATNEIPNCENCGEARQFEFQIMPQMLLLLKDASIDWGVLAIYTCIKSCKPPHDRGYLREYIIKQDILVANC